jgi:hypothetical protein
MSVKLPPPGHLHWLRKEGAKESKSIPKDYGWISSGWHSDGNFYCYFITDDDLNNKQWHKAIYVKSE